MGKMLSTATNHVEWQCKYHVLLYMEIYLSDYLNCRILGRCAICLSDITEHIPVCVDIMLILS